MPELGRFFHSRMKQKDIYGCLPGVKDNDDCRSRTYIRSLMAQFSA